MNFPRSRRWLAANVTIGGASSLSGKPRETACFTANHAHLSRNALSPTAGRRSSRRRFHEFPWPRRRASQAMPPAISRRAIAGIGCGRPAPRPRRPACRHRPPARTSRLSGSSPRSGTPSFFGLGRHAAMAEDMRLVAAVRADIGRHVLDQPEDRRLERLEHVDRLARIQQRDVLRRRDDDRAGHAGALAQRQLHVAGARRQVDDQHVELAPVAPGSEAAAAPPSASARARPPPVRASASARSTSS